MAPSAHPPVWAGVDGRRGRQRHRFHGRLSALRPMPPAPRAAWHAAQRCARTCAAHCMDMHLTALSPVHPKSRPCSTLFFLKASPQTVPPPRPAPPRRPWLQGSGVIAVVVFGLYGNATSKWGMLSSAEESGAFDMVRSWDAPILVGVSGGYVGVFRGVLAVFRRPPKSGACYPARRRAARLAWCVTVCIYAPT